MFTIDPEKITVPTSGPLYDERNDLPVDESMIASIIYRGQLQAILVRKNGPDLEVVAGRQRLKAILEINRRALERGDKVRMKIKAELVRGSDGELYSMMISENEIRRNDDPMVKAQKAKRHLIYGRSVKEIAVDFGVKVRAVEEWLSLTDVVPEVQKAIHAGDIAAGVGVALAELPRDRQAAKLEEMKAEAAKSGQKVSVHQARREVRARPDAPPRPKPRSGREMRSKLDSLCCKPIAEMTLQERHWSEALEWALGEIEILEAAPLARAKTPPRPNGQAAEAHI